MLPKLSIAGDLSYSSYCSTRAVMRLQNFCRREWYVCVFQCCCSQWISIQFTCCKPAFMRRSHRAVTVTQTFNKCRPISPLTAGPKRTLAAFGAGAAHWRVTWNIRPTDRISAKNKRGTDRETPDRCFTFSRGSSTKWLC